MAENSSVSSSAPAYEPEKWNNRVTPELRDSFFKQHRETILNINIREHSATRKLDELSRRMDEDVMSPERKGWVIQQSIEDFFRNDRVYKNDAALTELYGLKPSALAGIRRDFAIMREAYGLQDSANCYTYAMNDIRDGADRFNIRGGRRPGGPDASAETPPDYATYKNNLLANIRNDGAQDGGVDAQAKAGYYRVAVFGMHNPTPKNDNDNMYDMHFVRENGDGTWSHKFGEQPVTNKDKNGALITDPKTAQIGYDFLTYVYVPEGGIKLPQQKPRQIEAEAGQVSDINAMTEQVLANMRKAPVAKLQEDAAPLQTAIKIPQYQP